MSRSARTAALLGLGLALLSVSALFLGAWREFERGGLYAQIRLLSAAPDTWQMPADGGQFGRFLLEQAGMDFGTRPGITLLLRMQQWLGDQVCCVEVAGSQAEQAWRRVQAGKGLSCGGMAQLFYEMVAASGLPARVVQLYRSDFDLTDTHVLVEVLIDDRWVIFDPTFNLTFEDSYGHLLGVREVRDKLASGGISAAIPFDHGKRVYPASISDYYIDWRTLYGSAYLVKPCADCSVWKRLPPLRYWFGPVRYAFGDELGPFAREHNHYYFSVVVAYPLLFVVLVLSFLRVLVSRRGD